MNRFHDFSRRYFRPMYLLILLAAAGMYLVFAFDPLVWADEAYSFALAEHSFREIWLITAADNHPPLFYFFLKILGAPFGYNLFACRFACSLPCILLLAIGGRELKKLFGEPTALAFMVLYLLYPFTMRYAVEVRMYGFAELFIFLSAIWAFRCWKGGPLRDWIAFGIFAAAAAYCHYFALVSAGIIHGLLFLLVVCKNKKLFKHWAIAAVITIVLYVPWLSCFISQLIFKAQNPYWIEPITFSTLIDYVMTVFYAHGLAAFPLFLGACYVIALVILLLSRKGEHISLCLLALAAPLGTLAVGLAASFLVRPVFVIRYILPSIPLAVFFFAYVLANLTDEAVIASLLTVALMGGVSNAVICAKNALQPEEDRIQVSMIQELPECSAYVTLTGNVLHTSQEIMYCDPVTPVYTPEPLGADDPYRNQFGCDQFRMEEHSTVILVLAEGEKVPQEFAEHYESEKLRDVTVSGTPETMWLLTAK